MVHKAHNLKLKSKAVVITHLKMFPGIFLVKKLMPIKINTRVDRRRLVDFNMLKNKKIPISETSLFHVRYNKPKV